MYDAGMFHVVLFEPEIPPNTGNIIRLCANTGCFLHLIHPLGFTLEDKRMRRAGLDYHEYAHITHHPHFEAFCATVDFGTIYPISTKGHVAYTDVSFLEGDVLLLGSESKGLPEAVRAAHRDQVLYIPQRPHSRSLNLANAAAVVVYEAWRQHDFATS